MEKISIKANKLVNKYISCSFENRSISIIVEMKDVFGQQIYILRAITKYSETILEALILISTLWKDSSTSHLKFWLNSV